MKVYAARRAVASKIQRAVVSFAEQVEIVFKLFAGVAGKVAEFRILRLRDQLECWKYVETVFRLTVPQRFETCNISLSRTHR